MLLKVPCKCLKFHWREICQGSGVSSILIGRSILTTINLSIFQFPILRLC